MESISLESILKISQGKIFKTESSESEVDNSFFKINFLNVSPLQHATKEHVSFIIDEKYLESAHESKAGVILCSDHIAPLLAEKNVLSIPVICKYPRAIFAKVSQFFYQPKHPFEGISSYSMIDASAHIASTATIFPYVFIGPNAHIGEGTVLYPGCFVGAASIIGDECILYPNVVIREGCQIGHRCIFNPGAVIGGDGFGFDPIGTENVKVPQIGGVEIHDDVELGSNATIDRGAFKNTKIGLGTKLDNLVHIGHNTEVGEYCLFAGQTGIAGSTKIGHHVMMGGQTGVADNITISDYTSMCAQTGLTKNIEIKGGTWAGTPARLVKKIQINS